MMGPWNVGPHGGEGALNIIDCYHRVGDVRSLVIAEGIEGRRLLDRDELVTVLLVGVVDIPELQGAALGPCYPDVGRETTGRFRRRCDRAPEGLEYIARAY